MKIFTLMFPLALCIVSCDQLRSPALSENTLKQDSLALVQMISERERAMIEKDIDLAMRQFSDDVTWINSQGYLFEGKKELEKFHGMLSENDSLDYFYEAGKPKIRILDAKNAITYYSWKMFWFKKAIPTDTTFKEIGLMTLHAQKMGEKWKWSAITNQHTPWFYDEINPVKID